MLRAKAVREKRGAKATGTEHMAARAMADVPTASMRELARPEPDAPDVELYDTLYPERAALIRLHGGVPAGVIFVPPDEATVHALIAIRSPTLEVIVWGAA